jgi:hypothetical protein
MDLCVATTAPDIGLASILKGMLESAGVEVELRGSGLQLVPGAGGLGPIDVLVHEHDLALAKELLTAAADDNLGDDEE